MPEWDVFICHASEDKLSVAEPLSKALSSIGLNVWYDDYTLNLGDSLHRSIDQGLRDCRFGIVILSPKFFNKEWPKRELDGLSTRELEGDKIILPIWHNVTHRDVARFSLLLADKLAISTDKGMPEVVRSILRVVRPDTDNRLGIDFVLIPSGDFTMGAISSQDEMPTHYVTISQSLYFSKYLITQNQWQSILGESPSKFKGDSNRPVEFVSWDDTQRFIGELNYQDNGRHYRLPTEAEWEYACRAGSSMLDRFENDSRQLDSYGWYRANSNSETHPVGQLKANNWNLYDMHGNVWEWVQDWFAPYGEGRQVDPPGPLSGWCRVLRGGGWRDDARLCRPTYRGHWHPSYRSDDLGFRICMER